MTLSGLFGCTVLQQLSQINRHWSMCPGEGKSGRTKGESNQARGLNETPSHLCLSPHNIPSAFAFCRNPPRVGAVYAEDRGKRKVCGWAQSWALGSVCSKGLVGGFYGKGMDKNKGNGTGNCGRAVLRIPKAGEIKSTSQKNQCDLELYWFSS